MSHAIIGGHVPREVAGGGAHGGVRREGLVKRRGKEINHGSSFLFGLGREFSVSCLNSIFLHSQWAGYLESYKINEVVVIENAFHRNFYEFICYNFCDYMSHCTYSSTYLLIFQAV